MPEKYVDGVQQFATGTGTGALTLGNATSARTRRMQDAGIGDGDTIYVRIEHATINAEWEIVKVTYDVETGQITRAFDDASSSYTGSLISFSAGNKIVSGVMPSLALFAQIDAAKDAADGLSFQGEWSSGTTYTIGQSVSYSGSSYASRVDANLANQPDISTTQWQLMAGPGATGAAGADGALIITRWVAAVVANGGTVSAVEKAARAQFYEAVQEAGVYDLLDDFALLSCEPGVEEQALVTGKRRVLMTAMNSPVFTRRGVQFVAASSHHIKTGFIPSSHATEMDGSHMEGGVYSIENVPATTTPLGCYESTNKRFEITPRTGGGAYYFGFNAAPASFGTSSDSTGLVSYYRDDTTYGSRKNGVAGSTYSPASNATVLPGIELYIGARNANGTADQKYSGTLAFAYWGAPLTVAQTTALYAAVQAYLTTVGALDSYVSATSGSDTGVGDELHPYASWDKGYANTQAGMTMWLDGTVGSPQTYKSTASANTGIAKALTVRAINAGGAKVTSNGATNNALSIAPTAGQTINLIGLVVDPSLNGSASSLVFTLSLTSQSTAYTLNCTDCTFTGWTGASGAYGVYTGSANFKAHLTFTSCGFVGDTVVGAITADQFVEGGIVVDTCSFALTNQNLQSYGPVKIVARAAGIYARVIDCPQIENTIKASLTGGNQHLLVYIEGVAGAIIARNKGRMLGAGSPRSTAGYRIVTNGAGDSTELAIDGGLIEDNTVYCEPSGGGIACGFGNDGTGDNSKMVGCIMRRNTITGSAAAGAAGLHGMFAGRCRNLQSYNNVVNCGGINYVYKNLDGTFDSYGNSAQGFTSSGYLHKSVVQVGGRGSRNNTAIATAVSGTAPAFSISQDAAGGGAFSSGVLIDTNFCFNNGATSAKFVSIETGSSGTFTYNAYTQNAGSLNINPFSNGATNYTTFAAWKAAVGTTDAANFA